MEELWYAEAVWVLFDADIKQNPDWSYSVTPGGAIMMRHGPSYEEVVCFLPRNITKQVQEYQKFGYLIELRDGQVTARYDWEGKNEKV